MKRLKLESLEVESFPTSGEQFSIGTVRAHQATFTDCPECHDTSVEACGGNSNQYTCNNWDGCGPSGRLIPGCQYTGYIHHTCHGYPTCKCAATEECV